MKKLILKSPAFEDGDWIPQKYTGYGEDVSPEFMIEGVTDEGRSMVMTLDDASHPLFKNYNHWVAWNIPVVPVIPEGLPVGEVITEPIAMHQGMAYGKHCYRVPKPPFHWNHTYVFTVYVIDAELNIPNSSTREDVFQAMNGHVLQKGTLTGKYRRNHKECH